MQSHNSQHSNKGRRPQRHNDNQKRDPQKHSEKYTTQIEYMLAQGNEAKYSIKQVSCQPHRNWASPSIGQLVAVGLMILYMSYMVVYSSGMPQHQPFKIKMHETRLTQNNEAKSTLSSKSVLCIVWGANHRDSTATTTTQPNYKWSTIERIRSRGNSAAAGYLKTLVCTLAGLKLAQLGSVG